MSFHTLENQMFINSIGQLVPIAKVLIILPNDFCSSKHQHNITFLRSGNANHRCSHVQPPAPVILYAIIQHKQSNYRET